MTYYGGPLQRQRERHVVSALIEERDDLRASRDAVVRREQAQAAQIEEATRLGMALARELKQVRLYVEDALLVGEDDIGVVRDILHAALDVGR